MNRDKILAVILALPRATALKENHKGHHVTETCLSAKMQQAQSKIETGISQHYILPTKLAQQRTVSELCEPQGKIRSLFSANFQVINCFMNIFGYLSNTYTDQLGLLW